MAIKYACFKVTPRHTKDVEILMVPVSIPDSVVKSKKSSEWIPYVTKVTEHTMSSGRWSKGKLVGWFDGFSCN